MKFNRSLLLAFVLLIVVAALYRIFPNRPFGFAPQIAMCIFAGSMIKNKSWAFALPLFSMFLSDVLYQILFFYGLNDMPGFYEGQVQNYLLLMGVTCLGFTLKKVTPLRIFGYSLLAPTVFFIASNFLVWINNAGLARPKTWAGLMQCYADALPFYGASVMSSVVFSVLLFGGYYLLNKPAFTTRMA